jgi:hypothetical protein
MKDFLSAFLFSTFLLAACQTDDFVAPEPFKVDFTASDTVILQGDKITFTNKSTGVDSTATIRWVFEGGNPITFEGAVPPAVVYEDTGRYLVGLLILVPINDSSSQGFNEVKYVTVRPN